MFRFNLHARIEIAMAATLLLGSCGDSAYHGFTKGDYDRLDLAEVNARNAVNRVDSLERKIGDLEQKVGANDRDIGKAFSNADADRNTANGNAKILNTFKDHTLERLNKIESRLGI